MSENNEDWVNVEDEKPPNDYNFPCYIAFIGGHTALSNGGTVCNDVAKQITNWMMIFKGAKYLPIPPKK